ncbi:MULTISPECIES: hypothetical protein [unclassified Nostoc]|nr:MULTISPECIES: hypothetical protein [unclassified Nostoc]
MKRRETLAELVAGTVVEFEQREARTAKTSDAATEIEQSEGV